MTPYLIELIEFRGDLIHLRINEGNKMHDLELTAEQFLECVKFNEWAKPFVTTFNFEPQEL